MKMHLNNVIIVICLCAFQLSGQDISEIDYSIDTTKNNEQYYTDLSNQLILRFYTLYKTNNVNLSKFDESVKYRPNGIFSLGAGFNYKFLGLGISYGAPLSQSSKTKKGNTQRLDIQASLLSPSIGLDGFLQIYKGYFLSNPDDFTAWDNDNYPKLPDMDVLTLGINAFYIFNSKKFSYRAAYTNNQVQNKSAGSISIGLFGTYDRIKTNHGFVPPELVDSTQTEFDLKSIEALTIGLSVGYMHTFVFRKGFYLSLAGVPGIGYRHYEVVTLQNKLSDKNQFTIHFLGKIALGYTKERFYINFNSLFNIRDYKYKSYELSMSSEKLKLTFGLRLQTKASKRGNQYHPN